MNKTSIKLYLQNKNFVVGYKRKLKPEKEYIQFLCVFTLEILILTTILII
jgi:hypothetical protein